MLAHRKGKSKAEVESWTGYPGGAPCNCACGLGRLGVPTAFVSAIGNDERGDELMRIICVERNIDTSAIERVDAPTRDVYVLRTLDGDRIFDSFGHDTNSFCDCFIKAHNLPRYKIENAKVLVTGTLGLAYPATAEAHREAVKVAKAAGTTVLIDVNWRPVFWNEPTTALDTIMPYLQQADLVKLTDEEAEWAFGINAADALAHPEKAAQKLPNARGVLVTAGEHGMSYCLTGKNGERFTGSVPVYEVSVQDTTGAGDAFTCGLLAYALGKVQEREDSILSLLGDPKQARKAMEFAAACGALTTQRPGAIAAQPFLDEVHKLAQSRPSSIS